MSTEQIERAAGILRRGGLVAFPTETVYGLGGRALDPAALGRIFRAKGRPASHPLIAHVLGVADARALAARWPDAASRLAAMFWPGPLTLVVPRAAHVPLELTGGGESVGLRAPSHPMARALLTAFGEPIAAPSANRYQTLSPTTAAHVLASLGDRVDLILDGGPCSAGIESTVVDLRGDVPRILRPGALDLTTLHLAVPELVDPGFGVTPDGMTHASPGLDHRHYAPRTPLLIASHRTFLVNEARRRLARGDRVALLLVDARPDTEDVAEIARTASMHVVTLGADPVAYARDLFSTLHAIDALSVDVILVELVPSTPAWRAIDDRLRRAGEPL